MRRLRPSGSETIAAPSGSSTRPASQAPSGRASAGRSPYLRAWIASPSGPPKSPPALTAAKAGGAARQAPQTASGPGRPQRTQPDGTGRSAPAQTGQKGSTSAGSRQPAQRGGQTSSARERASGRSAAAVVAAETRSVANMRNLRAAGAPRGGSLRGACHAAPPPALSPGGGEGGLPVSQAAKGARTCRSRTSSAR